MNKFLFSPQAVWVFFGITLVGLCLSDIALRLWLQVAMEAGLIVACVLGGVTAWLRTRPARKDAHHE